MRLIKTVYVLVGLAACLAQFDAAQNCLHVSKSEPASTAGEQKIVIVELTLNRSGKVHDAKLRSGPATLAAAAIGAARRRKYPELAKRTALVAVTFAADGETVIDIRQAMMGGVPGCVVSTPVQVRISQEVMQRMLISRIEPEYPPNALTERTEAVVVLALLIDRDGTVSNVEKISGSDPFITPAMNAVKQWRFRPYYLNEEPVKVVTTMDVKFAP